MSHKSTGGSAREGAVLQAGVLCEVAAAAGRHLTSLRADGCSVSDAVLGALGTHCGALGTLSLVGCRGVTDAGLAAVAAGCPRCVKERTPGLVLYSGSQVAGSHRRVLGAGGGCGQLNTAMGRRRLFDRRWAATQLLRREDASPPVLCSLRQVLRWIRLWCRLSDLALGSGAALLCACESF